MINDDYIVSVNVMKQHHELMGFVGERPIELVRESERELGVIFPPSYRQFLLDFGAGNFGYFEIYGVIDNNFFHSSVPNGIWLTLLERTDSSLPNNLVIIAATGDGDYYCLDCSNISGEEAPVILYSPSSNIILKGEIAKSFGQFLYNIVNSQLP